MKKILLLAAIACGVATVQAQVTQINANQNLEFVGPIGTTKQVYASSTDSNLWVTDGSLAGTFKLSSTITHQETGQEINGKLIFRGSTPATGSELFVTDGTVAGTMLLKDVYSGPAGSDIDIEMATLNGYVYFTATNPVYGREIWKTNGTVAGTDLLVDIVTGPGGSNTAGGFNLFSTGTYLLFSADTPTFGKELYKSDGTVAGTNMVKDINTGSSSSEADAFFKLGNIILFRATNILSGSELWKTDGTLAGTSIVKDIYGGPMNSSPMLGTYFYAFNGKAYFTATDGINGEELWGTDGTEANTSMVKNIEPGPAGSFHLLVNAMKAGNSFVFPSTNLFGTRYELQKSDGTIAGTNTLKDFSIQDGELPLIFSTYELNGTGYTQPLFQGNKFFFMARTAAEGLELWISDGTTAGTHIVKNINPGNADGLEDVTYQYTNNAVYFSANDGIRGKELWKSDGTEAGTVMVADINQGPGGSDPQLWSIFNGKLIFSANDGNNLASDLFVLDGNVTPLPIKMGDISVIAAGPDAKLQWNTLQEINSKNFVIQRSEDGINFKNVGTVIAAGQSSIKLSYSFVDAGALQNVPAILYYRLLMVDKDGRSELSKVVAVQTGSKGWTAELLQNPVSSELRLKLNGLSAAATLKISDISGKVMLSSVANGNGFITLPVAGLPGGVYQITISGGHSQKAIRFIKD